LRDAGLALLLPHLSRRLPKLSHLSLARNGLRDVKLIAHLLQGRSAAQLKRLAVPLCILDLSQNDQLGLLPARDEVVQRVRLDATSLSALARSGPTAALPIRASKIGRHPCNTLTGGTHVELLRVVCEALRNGLIVRTLRLREMELTQDDLRPLLQMISREVAHRQSGIHGDFSLREVSLEGNRLCPEVLVRTSSQLAELLERSPLATVCQGPTSQCWESRPRVPRRRRRTQSTPLLDLELFRSMGGTPEPERDALSDGDDGAMCEPEVSLGPRGRDLLRQRFQEDHAAIVSRLEARGAEEVRRCPADMQNIAPRHRTSTNSSSSGRSEYGVIAIGQIPDMGNELGFAPPPHGLGDAAAGLIDVDTEDDASVMSHANDLARERQPEVVAEEPQRGDAVGRHARLEMLHRLFQRGGGNLVPGPEVLQYALEVISSTTSLNIEECEQAFNGLFPGAESSSADADVNDDDDERWEADLRQVARSHSM